MEIQHYLPEKFFGGGRGKFSYSAWRKRRPVSLNKFTEGYNSLLISLPKILLGELLSSIPEVSDEWESHWFWMHGRVQGRTLKWVMCL